jgi:hypothetical protein
VSSRGKKETVEERPFKAAKASKNPGLLAPGFFFLSLRSGPSAERYSYFKLTFAALKGRSSTILFYAAAATRGRVNLFL